MNIRRPHPERTAFSLVEVLIAILVLSLGLLGLGAVFPTILRQQRLATQTTLGLTAQNAAGPILGSNDNFRPGGRGWPALREYVLVATGGTDGEWIPVEPEATDPGHLGSYILSDPNDPTNPVFLPLSQRLYPLPYSTEVEPRFVWDMAARITDTADPANSPLMVAVFLRPIDTGIKPGFRDAGSGNREPYSLVATLLDKNLGNRFRRNPISVNSNGEPTFDGRRDRSARYATPIVAELGSPGIEIDPRFFALVDVLSLGTDDAIAVTLLAQRGQRFIDRNGEVFTVAAVERDRVGGTLITADRPLPIDPDGDGANFDFTLINPVIFLPTPTTLEPDIFVIKP